MTLSHTLCAVPEACLSGYCCLAVEATCSCNQHSHCPGGQWCDTAHDECQSTHCFGVACAACEIDSHCGGE